MSHPLPIDDPTEWPREPPASPPPLPPAVAGEAAARAPVTACARCSGPVDVRTPHVQIEGSAVRTYCSAACASAQPARAPDPAPLTPPPRARWPWRLGAALPMLLLLSGRAPVPSPATAVAALVPLPASPRPAEAPAFGPAWPPEEKDWFHEIAKDAWIHPLDGPTRRMPIRDGRVFGAERPGERPVECRSGHCGVDIGGEVWGEPVHAVHDGVVDRVQRGPNEDHGGIYVRLVHRDGTIFTQYFHLAAVPRRLQPGVRVRAGEVIGLIGDTGVKHSGAHLHFTVSVKPAAETPEQYIDPEPLIALWPLRMPMGGATVVTTLATPGVPRGAGGRPKAGRSHRRAAAVAAPAASEDGAASE